MSEQDIFLAGLEKAIFVDGLSLEETQLRFNMDDDEFLKLYNKLKRDKSDPLRTLRKKIDEIRHPKNKYIRYATWTSEELDILKKHYPNMPKDELCKLLPTKTWSAIKNKAYMFGLKRKGYWWTEEENKILVTHYYTMSIHELCKLLPNRTWTAIHGNASKKGLKRNGEWTEDELEIVKKHYPNMPKDELCKLLPTKTWSIIKNKAYMFGLKRKNIRYATWTSEELDILKKHYPTMPLDELCKLFPNRSRNAIKTKAQKIGLKRNIGIHWSQEEIEIVEDTLSYHANERTK